MELISLKNPFDPEDIEWRLQRSGLKNEKPWGMCLAYVTNRAIMDRLDKVVGPAGWKNEFIQAPEGGILCGISIKIDDEWITKWDGAENTAIEAIKGGLSGAMKRAAVQWGIGRYLYNLEATWALFCNDGKYSAKIEDSNKRHKYYSWNPPDLPAWALPGPPPKKKAPKGRNASGPRETVKEQLDGYIPPGEAPGGEAGDQTPPGTTGEPMKPQKTLEDYQREAGKMVLTMAVHDKDRAQDILEAITKNTDKGGRKWPGIRTIAKLTTEKYARVVYAKVKDAHTAWLNVGTVPGEYPMIDCPEPGIGQIRQDFCVDDECGKFGTCEAHKKNSVDAGGSTETMQQEPRG